MVFVPFEKFSVWGILCKVTRELHAKGDARVRGASPRGLFRSPTKLEALLPG